MVTVPDTSTSADAVPRKAAPPASSGAEPARWLIPGEVSWEVWERTPTGQCHFQRSLTESEGDAPLKVDLAALPATLVTCQLFWLETTDDKAVADLIRMQCERRSLLRNDEVFKYRIVRREEGRSLAMVLILQNTIPMRVLGEVEARFEAHARCLVLPPRALAVWRSLGSLNLGLTNEEGVVYFQSLPYHALKREALLDIRSILWLALAQNWVSSVESFVLLGDWPDFSDREAEQVLGLAVQRTEHGWLALPGNAMELVPRSVRQQRKVRRRQRRIKLGALVFAALYAVFLLSQILNGVFLSTSNAKLQKHLDSLMPSVLEMQETARALDALNPALDARTYPIEILYRANSVLPEKGVRLTRFEITGNRLEIGGESSTAREAFDYIRNLEEAESLNHIEWEDAPQPIPLPNDTTRFSVRGTIQGAYHDEPENP